MYVLSCFNINKLLWNNLFIYFSKYLISIKLKLGLIVICNNEACVISK